MNKELLNRNEIINKITKNRVCTFTFVCTLALLCIFSLNLINNSYLSSAEPVVVHTWDVSEIKNGKVMATLYDNGELIINGEVDGDGKLQALESYSSISPTNYLQLGYYKDPSTKERTYFKKVKFTGKVQIDNFSKSGDRITYLFDNWKYVEEIDCSGIVYNRLDTGNKFYFNGMINLKRIVLSESMKNDPAVTETPGQAKGNSNMPIYFYSYGNAFIGYNSLGEITKVYSGFDNSEADDNYCLNLVPYTNEDIAYLEAVPFNKTLMEYVNNDPTGDYYEANSDLYITRISKALRNFVQNKKAGKTDEFLSNDTFEILEANIDYIDMSCFLYLYLSNKVEQNGKYTDPTILESDINEYLTNILIPNIYVETGNKYHYLDDVLIKYRNRETLDELDPDINYNDLKMSQLAKYTDYNEVKFYIYMNTNDGTFVFPDLTKKQTTIDIGSDETYSLIFDTNGNDSYIPIHIEVIRNSGHEGDGYSEDNAVYITCQNNYGSNISCIYNTQTVNVPLCHMGPNGFSSVKIQTSANVTCKVTVDNIFKDTLSQDDISKPVIYDDSVPESERFIHEVDFTDDELIEELNKVIKEATYIDESMIKNNINDYKDDYYLYYFKLTKEMYDSFMNKCNEQLVDTTTEYNYTVNDVEKYKLNKEDDGFIDGTFNCFYIDIPIKVDLKNNLGPYNILYFDNDYFSSDSTIVNNPNNDLNILDYKEYADYENNRFFYLDLYLDESNRCVNCNTFGAYNDFDIFNYIPTTSGVNNFKFLLKGTGYTDKGANLGTKLNDYGTEYVLFGFPKHFDKSIEKELNYVTECNINVTPKIISPKVDGYSEYLDDIYLGSDDEYNYYDLFGYVSSGSLAETDDENDWFASIEITNDLTEFDDNSVEFTLYYYTTDEVFENIKFCTGHGSNPFATIDVINDESISSYKDITEWNEITDFTCDNDTPIYPLLGEGNLNLSEHLYLKVPKKVAVSKPSIIDKTFELTKTGTYDLFVRKFIDMSWSSYNEPPIYGSKSNHLTINVDELDISGKNDKVVRSIVSNKKFTGDVIKPTVHLVYTNNFGREVTLVEGRDYTLEYGDETHDNKTIGENTGLIIVKGIAGKTKGERKIEFSINDDGSGASDNGNDDDNKNKGDDGNKGNKGGDIKPSAPSTITIQSSKPNRLSAYMKGYDDKTFKPNGNMTRAEIATVLARLSDGFRENGDYRDFYNYKDINSYNGDWYNNYIGYCTLNGFLNGYGDTFKPNSAMTRAEFATALVKYLKLNGNGSSNTFKDINGKWYEDSVNILASYGFISGYDDNTFRGDKPISRAEVCTILNNALKRSLDNYNVTDYYKNMMRNTFTDVDENSWYYKDILEAVYAVK